MKKQSLLNFERDIKSCTTLEDMFTVVGKYYDIKNSKPGAIAKGIFISKIPSLTALLSAKPKKEHQ